MKRILAKLNVVVDAESIAMTIGTNTNNSVIKKSCTEFPNDERIATQPAMLWNTKAGIIIIKDGFCQRIGRDRNRGFLCRHSHKND